MVKYILVFILLITTFLGLWFLVFRDDNVKKASREGPVIFLGDSLTAGVGAGEGEDFPSLIAKEVNLENVINAGVSGDTSANALARLQKDVLDLRPSLVIVLLGGNDFLKNVPIEETVSNVDEIIRQISYIDSSVILVHLRNNPLNDKYKAPALEIATKYQTVLVTDILKGILGNSSLLSDTIHPNAAGYKLIADRIAPSVKKVLE